MFVSAIIAAGGRGARLGGAQPKQLLTIAGRSLLERSVSAFLSHPQVDEVIVALPADLAARPPRYLQGAAKPLHIVAGGERRQDSVARAFEHVAAGADIVVIHDAARPFASAELIARTIQAAAESGAAVAATPSRDTVKLVAPADAPAMVIGGDPANRYVRETLPRESIVLAQTPQAFRRDILGRALSRADDATDDALLVERTGRPVRVVEGEISNIKITTADDVPIAEAIAGAREPAAAAVAAAAPGRPIGSGLLRVGTGYDLHRLVEGRPLVIGGVTIPFERGALGHSDADVVCHAVTDAVLGAACLGDIGAHFPDTDPRWKDASSLDLLARAAALARAHGWEVADVDVTVVLERPKIRPFVDAMRAATARALAVAPECVSVKCKTNEGVDAVGRGEAIAAHAVALLRQRERQEVPVSEIGHS